MDFIFQPRNCLNYFRQVSFCTRFFFKNSSQSHRRVENMLTYIPIRPIYLLGLIKTKISKELVRATIGEVILVIADITSATPNHRFAKHKQSVDTCSYTRAVGTGGGRGPSPPPP